MKFLKKLRIVLVLILCICMILPTHVSALFDANVPEISRSFSRDEAFDVSGALERHRGGYECLSGDAEYYTDMTELASVIRDGLIARENTIVVGYKSQFELTDQFLEEVELMLFAHTGVGNEGDYLWYTFGGYYASGDGFISGGAYYYTLTYTVSYYTDAAQEAFVDSAVTSLKTQLKGDTEYETAKAIYDYICENVVYDYDNLEVSEYKLKFTAYAALANGTAVCQGYANLFYRLALECGLDARIISGTGGGGPHAWNIVKISGLYYNLDSTWDAPRKQALLPMSYAYFLKCDLNFVDHFPSDEFNTEEFTTLYPKHTEDYDAIDPAHRHEFSDEWTLDVFATSEASGEKSRHCTCGERCDVTEVPFVDASQIYVNFTVNDWSKAGIDFVTSNSLMLGSDNGEFMQDDAMTRAMCVTLLWRIAGRPKAQTDHGFTDIDPTQTWYHEAVRWAAENNIVNGTTETTFTPEDFITREQIATILYRYVTTFLGFDTSGSRADITVFADCSSISDYALDALSWANAEGLFRGITLSPEVTILDPLSYTTREQVAVLFTRFLIGE